MKKKTKAYKSETYKKIEYFSGGATLISLSAFIGNVFLGNFDAVLGWAASTMFAFGCTCLSHKLKFMCDCLKT